MEDQISNEEKLKIAQHYLLSSPPCQFNEILKDVRKLLPANLLNDSLATGIARAYNLKSGKVVTSPDGNKVVLSVSSEVDSTHYMDPITHNIFSVDHMSLVTTTDNTSQPKKDSILNSKQIALQKAISSYIHDQYKPERSGGGVYLNSAPNTLTIVISSEEPNLRNYWSGKWTSVWKVEIQGLNVIISGDIKVNAHYFEDGNIQLNTTRPIVAHTITLPPSATATTITTTTASSSSTNDIDFTNHVMKYIDSVETKTRAALDEMYDTLNTDTLKAMRRMMPITRTKMEWNVNSVRMNRQVTQKK